MSFVAFPQLSSTSLRPRLSFQPTDKKKISVSANCSIVKVASWNVTSLSRRSCLFMGFAPFFSNVKFASGAPLPQMEEPEIIRTRKLPGGIKVQDVVDGEGQAANEDDVVVFNYVCRRANGYFVYSTVDQFTGEAMPVTLPLNEKQIIKGLKDVLVGMKIGGKRRALIPPSMGYVNENLKPIPDEFGPRRSLLSHANEPLVFEDQAPLLTHDHTLYAVYHIRFRCINSPDCGYPSHFHILLGCTHVAI